MHSPHIEVTGEPFRFLRCSSVDFDVGNRCVADDIRNFGVGSFDDFQDIAPHAVGRVAHRFLDIFVGYRVVVIDAAVGAVAMVAYSEAER